MVAKYVFPLAPQSFFSLLLQQSSRRRLGRHGALFHGSDARLAQVGLVGGEAAQGAGSVVHERRVLRLDHPRLHADLLQ